LGKKNLLFTGHFMKSIFISRADSDGTDLIWTSVLMTDREAGDRETAVP
jgi:hypothetical protein